MQVRFADSRPTGDFALVLPVAGKDRSALSSLGPAQAAVVAALERQRFEGEAASAAEQFIDDGGTLRRVLAVGTGGGSSPGDAAEKLGGHRGGAPADIGRKDRRHRFERPQFRRRRGRQGRACRGASLVALRPLSHQAQGQAQADARRGRHRRRRRGRGGALRTPLAAGLRRRVADPRARHRARQHHLPRKLRRACPRARWRHSESRSRCSIGRRWRSSAWARCSASPRAR